MKKILGLLVSSMLVIGMVGCGADKVAEDAYEEAKDKVEEQTKPVEEPKDEPENIIIRNKQGFEARCEDRIPYFDPEEERE